MKHKHLTDQQFADLAQLPPQQAASKLLTMVDGDDHKAEGIMWATWEAIVGGSPGTRPKDREESDEARFCLDVWRVLTNGTEEPPVAQRDEHRRRIQAFNARSMGTTRIAA